MGETAFHIPPHGREQVEALFRDRSPVLVEVRFPRMGTSSDWYLLEDDDELDQLVRRLRPGVELHMASAWDVQMTRGKVSLVI